MGPDDTYRSCSTRQALRTGPRLKQPEHTPHSKVGAGEAVEVAPQLESAASEQRKIAFRALLLLKANHDSNGTLQECIRNLPPDRLWTTVTFSGLAGIIFSSRFIPIVPAVEYLIATIITGAAKGSHWTFHASEWLEKVCAPKLTDTNQPLDLSRRHAAWQNLECVVEWLRRSVSTDTTRAVSFIYRAKPGGGRGSRSSRPF